MFSGFETIYKSKLISPENAAGLVESGMFIHLGGAANIATIIDKYLAKRKDELEEVTVHSYAELYPLKICETDPMGEVFKWYSGTVTAFTRPYGKKRGVGIYEPSTWHHTSFVFRNRKKVDIFFLVTTGMDSNGYFNFGLTVGDFMSIVNSADKVVVIVNKNMPKTLGGYEECIHISQADYIVEDNETAVFCLPNGQTSQDQKNIAYNLINAGLVANGSTLQIGIGGLPDAVLGVLQEGGLKNLGVHSELLTEKVMDLVEAGIITNSEKSIDRLKSVFTFCMGSHKLYDYIENNPAFAIYPVDYTNSPIIIANQPKMFSLCSATKIDLTGQVASEQIPGERPYMVSGTGGQLDFVMGTLLAKDQKGVSVITVPSERDGESNIIPMLAMGETVSVPRSIVDCIATEWGIVRLRGLTVDDRAKALITISHPEHREELTRRAHELGIIPYRFRLSRNTPKGVLILSDL